MACWMNRAMKVSRDTVSDVHYDPLREEFNRRRESGKR